MPVASLSERLTDDSHARNLARKYVWWQPPEATLDDSRLFLAQPMTIGTEVTRPTWTRKRAITGSSTPQRGTGR